MSQSIDDMYSQVSNHLHESETHLQSGNLSAASESIHRAKNLCDVLAGEIRFANRNKSKRIIIKQNLE